MYLPNPKYGLRLQFKAKQVKQAVMRVLVDGNEAPEANTDTHTYPDELPFPNRNPMAVCACVCVCVYVCVYVCVRVCVCVWCVETLGDCVCARVGFVSSQRNATSLPACIN